MTMATLGPNVNLPRITNVDPHLPYGAPMKVGASNVSDSQRFSPNAEKRLCF